MADDQPPYEIDLGAPSMEEVKRLVPQQESADEADAERMLHASYEEAMGQLGAAPADKHRVDMEGLVLAGLSGQGVGALFRIDEWSGGVTLGMLVAVAGLLGAGYLWKRTRLPLEHLDNLPHPTDGDPRVRAGQLDAEQRAASRRRRSGELERIGELAADAARLRPRLRRAATAALAGAACGWLTGAIGPSGTCALAGSAAAATGAAAGWLAADAAWPEQRLIQVFICAMPGIAAAMALLCGANPWAAVGAAAALVAAGFFWRRRVLAMVAGVPHQPDAQP